MFPVMKDTVIGSIVGRRVWDSRGRPTVEAEVRLAGGAVGRAIAPGGSTAAGAAVDLRDGGTILGGLDVRRAVGHVNGDVALALKGADAADQSGLDARLEKLDGTPDFARIGGNAAIAVSMAAAQAAAASRGMPLWRLLREEEGGLGEIELPLPEIQIFAGGAHAGHRVDIQEFMLVCPGADSFAQALDWTAAVYQCAGKIMAAAGRVAGVADEGGWWPLFDGNDEALDTLMQAIELAGLEPGTQVAISLDLGASQFRRPDGLYLLASEGRTLDSDGMVGMLAAWAERYPIVAVEDPLAADDIDGLAECTHALGDRVQIVGDVAAATSASRVVALNAAGACNALLLKPDQAGTLTRTRQVLEAASKAEWGAIVSARSGESEDTTVVHLAVGWGIKQLKVGGFARSERMAKWNEVLRIEEAVGALGRLARPYL